MTNQRSRLPGAASEVSTLMPIHNTTGCVGHVLRTAKGFRACDAFDKEIGTFESATLAAAALLDRATTTDAV
jgi:hypothetical protein